jgi:hypothetical protein
MNLDRIVGDGIASRLLTSSHVSCAGSKHGNQIKKLNFFHELAVKPESAASQDVGHASVAPTCSTQCFVPSPAALARAELDTRLAS